MQIITQNNINNISIKKQNLMYKLKQKKPFFPISNTSNNKTPEQKIGFCVSKSKRYKY